MREITPIALVEIKTSFDSRRMEQFLNLTKELLDAVHHVHNWSVKLSRDVASPHHKDWMTLSHVALQLILALEQLKKCVIRPDIRFDDAWAVASKSLDLFYPQYTRMRMFMR